MTPKQLKEKIIQVLEVSDDAEIAHSREDALHLELIREFCPDWVVAEIERLSNADFARWCA